MKVKLPVCLVLAIVYQFGCVSSPVVNPPESINLPGATFRLDVPFYLIGVDPERLRLVRELSSYPSPVSREHIDPSNRRLRIVGIVEAGTIFRVEEYLISNSFSPPFPVVRSVLLNGEHQGVLIDAQFLIDTSGHFEKPLAKKSLKRYVQGMRTRKGKEQPDLFGILNHARSPTGP